MLKMLLRLIARLSGTVLPEEARPIDEERKRQITPALYRQPFYEAELRAFGPQPQVHRR
jgi:hypothetical protein